MMEEKMVSFKYNKPPTYFMNRPSRLFSAPALLLTLFLGFGCHRAATVEQMTTEEIGALTIISFSPDGKRFAYFAEGNAYKGELRIRDLERGTMQILGTAARAGVQFSPDGSKLSYFLNHDYPVGELMIWDSNLQQARKIDDGVYHQVQFGPDGNRLTYIKNYHNDCQSGEQWLWDSTSRTRIHLGTGVTWSGLPRFNNQGNKVLTLTYFNGETKSADLEILDLDIGGRRKIGTDIDLSNLYISPKTKKIIFRSLHPHNQIEAGAFQIWDFEKTTPLILGTELCTRCFRFDPNGRWMLYVTSFDSRGNMGTIVLHSLSNGREKRLADKVFTPSIRVSPDGTKVAYLKNFESQLSFLGELEACYLNNGNCMLMGVGATSRDIAFSPDGQKLAYLTSFDNHPSIFYMYDGAGNLNIWDFESQSRFPLGEDVSTILHFNNSGTKVLGLSNSRPDDVPNMARGDLLVWDIPNDEKRLISKQVMVDSIKYNPSEESVLFRTLLGLHQWELARDRIKDLGAGWLIATSPDRQRHLLQVEDPDNPGYGELYYYRYCSCCLPLFIASGVRLGEARLTDKHLIYGTNHSLIIHTLSGLLLN